MLAGGLTASAQWEKPVFSGTYQPLVVGDTVYLYNVDAKAFWVNGDNWGTHASIGDTGIPVVIQDVDLDGSQLESDYLFYDYPTTKGAWMNVFIDNIEGDIYTDRGSQPNYYFTFNAEGNNIYTIQGGTTNPSYSNGGDWEGAYVGHDPDFFDAQHNVATGTGVVYGFPDEKENGFNYHWTFVSRADYEAYAAKVEAYLAAEALSQEIAKAKEQYPNIDLAAEERVYRNTQSSKEELEAAAEAVKKKVADYGFDNATVANPADLTSLIVNPAFDSGSNSGWSGNAPSIEYNVGEWYNMTFDCYQKITGLRAGVYQVKVAGYYRNGGYDAAYNSRLNNAEALNAQLYAIGDGDTLTNSLMSIFEGATELQDDIVDGGTDVVQPAAAEGVWIPNMRYSASQYVAKGKYDGNSVYIAIDSDSLIIGAKKTVAVGSDWTLVDNWQLFYLGNSAEANQLILAEAIKNMKVYPADTECQKSLLAEYNALARSQASTAADIKAIVKKIKDTEAALDENIAAYAEYKSTREDVMTRYEKYNGEAANLLAEYLEFDSETIVSDGQLSTEEMVAETAKLVQMEKDAMSGSLQPGDEVLIVNGDFDNGLTGWSWADGLGDAPVPGGSVDNPNAERWNQNFDFYQVVTDLPEGIYEVRVQAFYRTGSNSAADADAAAESDTEGVLTYVYVNDAAAPVWNVMKGGSEEPYDNDYTNTVTGLYVPNSMVGASGYFSATKEYSKGLPYWNSVKGSVGEDRVLKFGIRNTEGTIGDRWSIWDNFHVFYLGKDAQAYAAMLSDKLAEAQAILDNREYIMANTAKTALSDIVAEGNTAIQNNNVDDIISVYERIQGPIDDAKVSIEAYNQLEAKAYDLGTALETYYDQADPKVFSEANALYDEVENAVYKGTYTNEEALAKIDDVNAYITMLKLPAGYQDATEENPADVSNVIINAYYLEDTNDGWQGTAAAVTYNEAEIYNTNYDYYQEIFGIPAGFYRLSLQGFYRAGFAEDDLTNYNSDPEGTANARLYVKFGKHDDEEAGSNAASAAPVAVKEVGLVHMFSETTDGLEDGTDQLEIVPGVYVPNTMYAASLYFQDGMYKDNVIEFEVKSPDTGKFAAITIGLKKTVQIAGDWTIFTDWKLDYLGTTPPTAINKVSNDSQAAAVSTAYFTVNGARVAAPQKGINIVKKTLSDGTVKVQKILVK